ncbi:MAG: hypothetical protein RLZZ576_21 [Actinomycetota bacterium]|jgi:hypothetical protein
MANEAVQYPSYSQKAAYPVSHKPVGSETSIEHKPVAAETAIEALPAEAVDFVEVVQATTPEVVDEFEATTADITETAPASQDQAPKFFPLVPVSSKPVVEADAVAEAPAQAEVTDPVESDVAGAVESEPFSEPVVEPDISPELSPFQISGSLVLEPQTNSIVIAQVPDALLAGSIVTETGEILTTGAIEIIAPPATGEIEIIPDSPDADSADAIDSATEYVSSVAPIRSSGVMNSKAKIGVLPGKLRKSMEHVVLATTLAVSIITVSSLLALAYMFGILR